MVQHHFISLLAKLQREQYPQIETAIISWFHRQLQRFPYQKGLVIYQLRACQQWQNRMEMLDLSIQSLATIPLALEVFIQHDLVQSLLDAHIGHNVNLKIFDYGLADQVLFPIYTRCLELTETFGGYASHYRSNGRQLLSDVSNILRLLNKLNDTDWTVSRSEVTPVSVPAHHQSSISYDSVQDFLCTFRSTAYPNAL